VGRGILEEAAAFPNGHDDQVDAMTQALNRLRTIRGNFPFRIATVVIRLEFRRTGPEGMAATPNAVAAFMGARRGNHPSLRGALSCPTPSHRRMLARSNRRLIPGRDELFRPQGPQAEKDRIAHLPAGSEAQTTMPGEEYGVYQLWQLLA
jgi:hypothetical protein